MSQVGKKGGERNRKGKWSQESTAVGGPESDKEGRRHDAWSKFEVMD